MKIYKAYSVYHAVQNWIRKHIPLAAALMCTREKKTKLKINDERIERCLSNMHHKICLPLNARVYIQILATENQRSSSAFRIVSNANERREKVRIKVYNQVNSITLDVSFFTIICVVNKNGKLNNLDFCCLGRIK